MQYKKQMTCLCHVLDSLYCRIGPPSALLRGHLLLKILDKFVELPGANPVISYMRARERERE